LRCCCRGCSDSTCSLLLLGHLCPLLGSLGTRCLVRGLQLRLPSRENCGRSCLEEGEGNRVVRNPSDWTALRLIRCCRSSQWWHLLRVFKEPQRSTLRGGKSGRARPSSLCLRRDGESAPRDMLPGERVLMARCFVNRETLDSRRPLVPRAVTEFQCLPLVARFTLRARRSNRKVAGSITCFAVPG